MDLRHEMQRLGVRRLSALVEGLPPDSALGRDGGQWTPADELAALTLERQEMWWLVWTSMNVEKGDKGKLPKPIGIAHPDRPVPPPPPRKKIGLSEVARLFGGG